MRVLVNAVSLKEGGTVTALNCLLPAMAAERPDIDWLVAVNPRTGLNRAKESPIRWLRIDVDRSPAHLVGWYELGLPRALLRFSADVLFSMTNYLPRRSVISPSLLMVQHAGHFSSEYQRVHRVASPSWLGQALWRQKTRWVCRSIERADGLVVQTAALADRIAEATRRPRDRIRVVPFGPGFMEHRSSAPSGEHSGPWRIGYISTWSPHKNFATVVDAIGAMAAGGLSSIRLVLTLDPGLRKVRELLARARAAGVEHLIENHGVVSGDALGQLYDSLDVFVFASVCESFGLPMVEAMARGLPIVAADTPEIREVTANAAQFFPPYDGAAMAQQLRRLIMDAGLRRCHGSMSLERGRDFSWKLTAQDMIDALEATAGA